MTEDTRLMASLKKVKNIRQYVFSGRTGDIRDWKLPEKVWLNPEKEQSDLNQAA
jgi:hypothetical protein